MKKRFFLYFLAMSGLFGMTVGLNYQFSDSVAYGAVCPACKQDLSVCYSCGSNLRCYSCRHCWGCGRNGY